MTATFLNIPLWIWGLICLAIALVWVVVDPGKRAASAQGTKRVVLRWFHTLVWLFLSLSCFWRWFALPGGDSVANLIAFVALPTYLIYMGTLFSGKKA